ncbi:hypothetical protein L3Q82_024474, partial [Scortum barcoo]
MRECVVVFSNWGVVVGVQFNRAGIMPVVSSQEELEKLTRRHAVKVLPQAGCSVEEVGSAVGEVVVGWGLRASSRSSRMNSAVVIFLDEVVKVERKVVRRQLYMILKDADSHLNLTLNFKVDGFNYIVFVTSETYEMFWLWGRGASHPSLPRGQEGGNAGGRRLLGAAGGGRRSSAREGQVEDALGSGGGGGRRPPRARLDDALKKLDVLFVQETHSDSSNERDWRREWPGQVFLSHKQSNSAGVGILFSRAFSPQSVELHHVLPGHALMVKALYEKGALVRSRFMNASMLDSPSKFFFSLERRNGQRKVIHCLRSDNGSSLTETTEIRRTGDRSLCFCWGLQGPVEGSGFETQREVMAEVVHVDQTYCVCARQAVLFLPKEEGGQGLVHLAGSSRCAAFRLQFIQRLLYGPQDLVWRPLAQLTLRSVGGLGLQQSVFLMDFKTVNLFSLPVFYRGLFSMWKLLRRQRVRHESLFWLLQEPMAHGDLMSAPSWVGAAVAKDLRTAGISTLGALMEYAGPDLQETAGLAAGLGWRSQRSVGRLLDHWRACLAGQERRMLGEYSRVIKLPPVLTGDPFPSLIICPSSNQQGEVNLKEAKGKVLSALMVM